MVALPFQIFCDRQLSQFHAKFFPEWEMVELESLEGSMSATPVREAYYRGEIQRDAFPEGTIQFLEQFQKTKIYEKLAQKFVTQDKSNIAE